MKSGGESNHSSTSNDVSAGVSGRVKRGRSPSASQRMAKRRRQCLRPFPAIYSSEDESDDSVDSQMSEYLNGGNSDETSSSKTSHSDGSVRRGFSSLRSNHYSKSSPVNSAEPLSWPIAGFLERTGSGSVILTLGLFANPSDDRRATEPIQFKSGDSSAQFGARLEHLAAGTPFTTTKCKAGPARSNVKFTPQEDSMLIELREHEGLSWGEIGRRFPHRTKASLQVHYSTKLKERAT